MDKVEKINKRELRLNPLSAKIYGEFSFQNELDIALLRSIILEESYKNLQERRTLNERRSVKMTPQMLRQMILEESRRYR
jgi:hypothetical protein